MKNLKELIYTASKVLDDDQAFRDALDEILMVHNESLTLGDSYFIAELEDAASYVGWKAKP